MLAEHLEHIACNRVRLHGRELRYYAGGDYHGFARDPAMLAVACADIEQRGLQVSASRGSTGNDPVYDAFEAVMADYFNAPAATLCSSGFVANLALVEALVEDFEHFVVDASIHSSSQYALRWAGKPISRFAHHDTTALEAILVGLGDTPTLVLSDTVGGMLGDLAPVPELLAITQAAGATLMLDDSHALGVIGFSGRGAVEAFDIDPQLVACDRVIRTGSLHKALGAHGGLVLGSHALREKVQGTTTFYTASPVPLAPMAVARRATDRLADGALCATLRERALTQGRPAQRCSSTSRAAAPPERFHAVCLPSILSIRPSPGQTGPGRRAT